jgi:hypothetical protein
MPALAQPLAQIKTDQGLALAGSRFSEARMIDFHLFTVKVSRTF